MDESDYQEILERRRARNRSVEYRDELGGYYEAQERPEDIDGDKPRHVQVIPKVIRRR